MLIKYLPSDKILTANETLNEAEEIELPEVLKGLKNIDVKTGIEHCGGLHEYLEVLEIYANSISTSADEIERLYNAEDWKGYTTKVHALKSSSRIIGAIELSERAAQLEDAGNFENIDEIKQDTKPMLELYRSYVEELKAFIKIEEDDSDKPLITDYDLAEAFEAMRDAAASFDYDTINFIFESLDEYRLPKKEAERYKKIKDAAAKLDWAQINDLLD